MLVLARRKGESIVIGGNVEIVVLATEGETVKLGIRAPKEVEVHRKEVYESIQEANKEAAKAKTAAAADLRKLLGKSDNRE